MQYMWHMHVNMILTRLLIKLLTYIIKVLKMCLRKVVKGVLKEVIMKLTWCFSHGSRWVRTVISIHLYSQGASHGGSYDSSCDSYTKASYEASHTIFMKLLIRQYMRILSMQWRIGRTWCSTCNTCIVLGFSQGLSLWFSHVLSKISEGFSQRFSKGSSKRLS